MSMIDDRTGLMTTAFLILAIAGSNDKEDMKIAAGCVSSFSDHQDLLTKYWPQAHTIEAVISESMQKYS